SHSSCQVRSTPTLRTDWGFGKYLVLPFLLWYSPRVLNPCRLLAFWRIPRLSPQGNEGRRGFHAAARRQTAESGQPGTTNETFPAAAPFWVCIGDGVFVHG